MALHSGTVVWRIPWTEKSGRIQSIGTQRGGHDRSDLAHMHVANLPLRIRVRISQHFQSIFHALFQSIFP